MWWRRGGAAALVIWVTTAGCGPGRVERAARQGRAAAEDRPLVVEFWATWCGPCKYFEEYTLRDERVKRALADVRFLRIDGEKEPGEMRKCGASSYPTFVVLSDDGKVVARMKGTAGAAGFIDFLQWGAPNAFDESVIARRMAERPSLRGLLYQARLHAMKGHLPQSAAAYRQAIDIATDATRRADIEWELALLESAGGTVAELAARAARFATDHPTAANALGAAEIAIASGTLPASEVHALAGRLLTSYQGDVEALTGFVYALLAARAYDEALAAARRQVELAPAAANPYDTLAEVHYHRGERAAALETAARAVALAKESDLRASLEANRKRFGGPPGNIEPALKGTRDRVEAVLRRYRIGAR